MLLYTCYVSAPYIACNPYRMFLGSLLDLSKYGNKKGGKQHFDVAHIFFCPGFVRERPTDPLPDFRRNSVESENCRTYSDTSMGPPIGRFVLRNDNNCPYKVAVWW